MRKKLVLFGLAAVIAAVMAVPVAGDELTDAQNEKDKVSGQINNLNKQKQDEKNKLNNVQQEKAKLSNAQSQAQKAYQQSVNELEHAEEEAKELDNSVKEAEKKYKNQKELLKKRIRIMYQNSNTSYMSTLAQSENLGDFLGKVQILSSIAKKDQVLANTLEAAKNDVEYKRTLKEEQSRQIAKLTEEKKRTVNNLQASRSMKEEEERKLTASLAAIEQKENELLKKSEELASLINNLKVRRKGGYVNGQMTWPAPGYGGISSYYGNRKHPVLGTYRMHTGIDIAAPQGAAIVAANKGTVVYAGWQDGYGNTIMVDHGGDIITLYAHCSSLLGKVGQEVDTGTVIAKVGSTGLSTGPHLHFEVRTGGSTVDPLGYVSP